MRYSNNAGYFRSKTACDSDKLEVVTNYQPPPMYPAGGFVILTASGGGITCSFVLLGHNCFRGPLLMLIFLLVKGVYPSKK